MKIIKEIDPDQLVAINKDSSIIICIPPDDKNIKQQEIPDIYSIVLTQDTNLSTATKISTHLVAIDFKPRIKIMTPVGVIPNFRRTQFGNLANIFENIYVDYKQIYVYESVDSKILKNIVYQDLLFILYIDVIQMREKMSPVLLPKNNEVVDLYFTWYIQTNRDVPMIEEIYLIKDLYTYQEFVKVLG